MAYLPANFADEQAYPAAKQVFNSYPAVSVEDTTAAPSVSIDLEQIVPVSSVEEQESTDMTQYIIVTSPAEPLSETSHSADVAEAPMTHSVDTDLSKNHELSSRGQLTVSEKINANSGLPQTQSRLRVSNENGQHGVVRRDADDRDGVDRATIGWVMTASILTSLFVLLTLAYWIRRLLQRKRRQRQNIGADGMTNPSLQNPSTGSAMAMNGNGVNPTQPAKLQQAPQGENVV